MMYGRAGPGKSFTTGQVLYGIADYLFEEEAEGEGERREVAP
jgi:hypothetical protein